MDLSKSFQNILDLKYVQLSIKRGLFFRLQIYKISGSSPME